MSENLSCGKIGERPPGDFSSKARNRSKDGNRFSRDIEDLMIGMALHLHPQDMLDGGEHQFMGSAHPNLKTVRQGLDALTPTKG